MGQSYQLSSTSSLKWKLLLIAQSQGVEQYGFQTPATLNIMIVVHLD